MRWEGADHRIIFGDGWWVFEFSLAATIPIGVFLVDCHCSLGCYPKIKGCSGSVAHDPVIANVAVLVSVDIRTARPPLGQEPADADKMKRTNHELV